MINIIPVSAIIPTAHRADALKLTLESIAKQSCQPAEIIIIDASADDESEKVCSSAIENLSAVINYHRAIKKGAAIQRIEGLKYINNQVILFCDDDIKLEPFCIERLWHCLNNNDNTGAVNSMVTNQQYHTPGKVTGFMYRIMSSQQLSSYAGRCIGPAWNLLPEDRPDLPENNEVEWLNTTCTMYKVAALPDPVFPEHFEGYSYMEDVCLSLNIGKKWKLFNARTARIFHDSRPGTHKNNIIQLSKMELVNRHYIMARVLKRSKITDYCKLFLFEIFGIVTSVTNVKGLKRLVPVVAGKFAAIGTILFTKRKS